MLVRILAAAISQMDRDGEAGRAGRNAQTDIGSAFDRPNNRPWRDSATRESTGQPSVSSIGIVSNGMQFTVLAGCL
ncbi:MAG: hypothetical protein CMJ77_25105 [Planctomycetaceae bacterium]|nr:hypothetical protein [Planctomycetaceae bacterium]